MTHLNLPERIHGDLHKEPCINDGELPSAAKNDMELLTNSAFEKLHSLFHSLSPLCTLLDSSLIELNAKSPS